MGVGLSGFEAAEDADLRRVHAILVEALGLDHLAIASDGLTSLFGALGARDGAVAAAGTGTVVLARRGDAYAKVDGWGSLLGDAGSGFAIGRGGPRLRPAPRGRPPRVGRAAGGGREPLRPAARPAPGHLRGPGSQSCGGELRHRRGRRGPGRGRARAGHSRARRARAGAQRLRRPRPPVRPQRARGGVICRACVRQRSRADRALHPGGGRLPPRHVRDRPRGRLARTAPPSWPSTPARCARSRASSGTPLDRRRLRLDARRAWWCRCRPAPRARCGTPA